MSKMTDIESAGASSDKAFPTSHVMLPDPSLKVSPETSRLKIRRRPSSVKLPRRLIGRVRSKFHEYLPLRRAISEGNLEAVKDFLNHHPDAITAWIDVFETPLLKACSHGQVEIVKELLRRMTPEQVVPTKEYEESPDNSPLSVAAMTGNLEIAEALILKNPRLLEIPGDENLPVVCAVQNGHKEMARFLYHKTPPKVLLADEAYHGYCLLSLAIYYRMLDIALDMFELWPRLAVTKHPRLSHSSPLVALAEMPELFPSSSRHGSWRRRIYSYVEVNPPSFAETSSPNQHESLFSKVFERLSKWLGIHEIYEQKEMHWRVHKLLTGMCKEISAMEEDERDENEVYMGFFAAVSSGNKEFVMEMIRWNPEFLWYADKETNRGIFHMAVEFRQEKIFDLVYGLNEMKNIILDTDHDDNGILHIAGGLSPQDKLSEVAGAALKMQRELQWFKEVESIVSEMDTEDTNDEHLTGREIFERDHEPLRKEAEEWMKGTATACSVVAALIATVTFQAVFTVPGGTDQTNGHPLHLKDAPFIVFVVADTLSFFASCISVLILLGILTARYSFDDFLVSLPSRMIAGLSALFISVAAMLVAFSTALFTTLRQMPSLVIPVLPLACLPSALFVMLQYPLLKEMISSTYGKGIFDRDTNPWF